LAKTSGSNAPLSLYIDLQPDKRADLEVVGRAAVAWAQTIREAAFQVDPFLEVRVELVSGTEGSLNLNSVIQAVRDVLDDPMQLKAIGLGVAVFFALEVGGWGINKALDGFWDWVWQESPEIAEELTDEKRKEIEEIVLRIVEAKSARANAQEVYKQLSQDNSVRGVGVSLRPEQKPVAIVPRDEFSVRSGIESVVVETVVRRTVSSRVSLTLVSPALTEDEYKWRFRLGDKTLWAYMADDAMQARITPGSSSAPGMTIGIVMDVTLQTIQEMNETVWENVEHRVVKVHTLREPASQPSLLSSPTKDEKAGEDKG